MDRNPAFDGVREIVKDPSYFAIQLKDGVMIFNCPDYDASIARLSEIEPNG